MSEIILSFGKHKGKLIDNVPASYLLWLGDQDWLMKFPDIQAYIEKERDHLEHEAALESAQHDGYEGGDW